MFVARPRTFKVSLLVWIVVVFTILFYEFLLLFAAILIFPYYGLYIGLLLNVISLGICLRFVLRPLRLTHITVGSSALSGWVGPVKNFNIPWKNIEASRCYYRRAPFPIFEVPVLWIATSGQSWQIPLSLFDQALVWRLVKLHVRPNQRGKAAMKAWQKRRTEYNTINVVGEVEKELLTVNGPPLPLLGWGLFLVGGFFSTTILLSSDFEWMSIGTLLFLWLLELSGVLLTFKRTLEMSRTGVTYLTPWGCCQMRWSDINHVTYVPETTKHGVHWHRHIGIIFYGKGKILYVPGPANWTGEDRIEMRDYLRNQLRFHGSRSDTKLEIMWFSKNTRIPWREYIEQLPAHNEERRALARSVWISAILSLSIAGLSTLGIVVWALVRMING